MLSILETMREPALFSRWFKDPTTWAAWCVFLSALFGLPLEPAQSEVFRRCTGRAGPLASGYVEAWLTVGRRGGKSIILALIAVYLAVFRSWSGRLVPGERGTVLVIAADRRQARVIFRYITALITETPLIAPLVDGEATQDRIDLTNGISIEISTANFRSVRGYTLIACLCDEIAFWMGDDSANPDTEILAAIRPAMTTMAPDAMLLCASSPYAQRGALYDAFKKHFARDDAPVLVWKASTQTMNPSVPPSVIDEAYGRDPAAAAAEYGAEFRTDVEGFVRPEVVEACIVPGRFELPPIGGVIYSAFVDPSGGSADSMTLAISHRDGDEVILDLIREVQPPFNPDQVVSDFAGLLKSYRIGSVTGDRYAGQWVSERFRAHGIELSQAAKPKSDIYRDFLPVLNSGGVELLDNPRLRRQLIGLERRTARGGRDTIDHAPGANDDVANAVAGAVVGSAIPRGGAEAWIEFYRRLNQRVAAPPRAEAVRVVVPSDQWPTTIIGISGANYLVHGSGEDRFLMMSSDDAKAFIHSPTSPSSWREINPSL
ncbi:MAG TPA: hypothetical protein VN345_13065 [Blastocatellia bacterium]|nr:hypothetical protein [Blastocatellia bacterium]